MAELQETLKAFGSRVLKMRERRDMTQKDLADDSGLSQSTVSRIESGLHNLTMENIFDLADGLECRVSSLMKDFI